MRNTTFKTAILVFAAIFMLAGCSAMGGCVGCSDGDSSITPMSTATPTPDIRDDSDVLDKDREDDMLDPDATMNPDFDGDVLNPDDSASMPDGAASVLPDDSVLDDSTSSSSMVYN